MNTPLILDDQVKVIEWARCLQRNRISITTAIKYLVSNETCESSIISEGLEEVRAVYEDKNSAWREQLLRALMLDSYQLKNDIKEGQIVTNGIDVGFACDVNYKTRRFGLSYKQDGSKIVDWFNMDDFKKV